jgi:hypothetical protein
MRHARIMAVTALLVTLGGSAPLSAQAGDAEVEIRALVDRMFDGMKEADSAKVRSVFADGARFAGVGMVDGAPTVRFQPIDGWLRGIAGSGGSWEERTYDVEVLVDGNMAFVWAPYTFLVNGAISHCGINSINVLRAGDRWLVTQISDTRHQGSCRER